MSEVACARCGSLSALRLVPGTNRFECREQPECTTRVAVQQGDWYLHLPSQRRPERSFRGGFPR